MKIYTEVVFDMKTCQIVREELYEYEGPVDQCLGGGSSGSASSSGKIDYPDYLKDHHGWALWNLRTMLPTWMPRVPATVMYDPRPIIGFPDARTPYTELPELLNFDPYADFDDVMNHEDFSVRVLVYQGRVNELWADLVEGPGYSTAINEVIAAHSAKLESEVNQKIIPKIEVGFRDAGAVIGSNFTIAKAIALGDLTKEISDVTAKLHIHSYDSRMGILSELLRQDAIWLTSQGELAAKRTTMKAEILLHKMDRFTQLSHILYESMGKYSNLQTESNLRAGTWAFDLFEHFHKSIASIAGAATVRQWEDRGAKQFGAGQVVAGAALGAAAGLKIGTALGGPQGSVVGGIVGAGVGLLGSLFNK